MAMEERVRIHTEIDELTTKLHELIDSGNVVVKAVLTVWLESLQVRANSQSQGSSKPGECLMTTDEVADYLRLTKQTIYVWVSDNSIPHLKLNGEIRFRRSEIDAWMEPSSSKIEFAREKSRQPVIKSSRSFPAANR